MNFSSSELNITWFRDQYRDGRLIIKPPYQRKPVWTARQKCYLIESILLGLPIPEIYVQQSTTPQGDTTYAIVDGQQRIRAILQFLGAETDETEKDYNKFSLDKLPTQSQWRGFTFKELSDVEKKNFYGYRFGVRYLNTDSDDDVRDMFRRLNKFLTPLKPQELRNATYAGPFVDLVLSLANNEYWAENRIVSPALIRRMNDVEFVSELLIGVTHGPQGGSVKVIDSYYERYEDFEDEFPDQTRAKKSFEDSLDAVRRVLPNIKETRWSNKTDFYTLFVAMAAMLTTGGLTDARGVRKELEKFGRDVETRLADEHAKVSKEVIRYVHSVEKGANEKARRGERHLVMTALLKKYFNAKKKTA